MAPTRDDRQQSSLDVGEFIDAIQFDPTHIFLTWVCAAVALFDGHDTFAIAYAVPAILLFAAVSVAGSFHGGRSASPAMTEGCE